MFELVRTKMKIYNETVLLQQEDNNLMCTWRALQFSSGSNPGPLKSLKLKSRT